MVEVWLPYGFTEVFATIPDEQLVGIIKPDIRPLNVEKEKLINEAFENPVEDERLENILESKKKVAIVIGRDYESEAVFEVYSGLIELIKKAGIEEEKISLFFPSDFNGFSVEPLKSKLLNHKIKIEHHNQNSDLIDLGYVDEGGDIKLNKLFTEADVKIAVGVVTPHRVFGYKGAPFKVSPGLMDVKTIKNIFSKLKGPSKSRNTIFKYLREIFDHVNVDFSINIITDQNGDILDITTGPLWKSYLEAVRKYEEIYKIDVVNNPEIIVGSVGGSPYDDELFGIYQSICTAIDILEEEGTLVLAAEWRNWYSSMDIFEKVSNLGGESKLKAEHISDINSYICHMLLQMLEKTDISLVSTIPHYYSKRILKMRVSRTVNSALKNVKFQNKDKGKILVAPNLYHIIPYMKG